MGCGNRLRDASGQTLVLTVIFLVVLLGMAGFAVDVGHAYLVQRQLQAGVDAAALAGAQELPDGARAISAAQAYGPTPGAGKPNGVTTVDNAVTTVETPCIASAPGCSATFGTVNAVRVRATSTVPTFFARVLGRDSFTVKATGTACSPCSAKPLDIMVVLDRTGSMCTPSCQDLDNATNGIKTFLSYMDPSLDAVGLAVFPPALDRSSLCTAPTNGARRYGYDAYWPEWIPDPRGATPAIYAIGSPVQDYLVQGPSGWAFNPSSSLIRLIEDCVRAGGTTSYANAIDEAQHELDVHGRGDVQDVIIVVTDGAANTTPRHVPSYVDNAVDRARPCGSGVKAAAYVKGRGTIVYTIGYDVDGDTNGGRCQNEGLTARQALGQMASEPDNFYDQPDPVSLNRIFTQIAADIFRPASRLIDDSLA